VLEGTLVFDLETQYLAEEVGGWTNIHRLGFAAGALLHVETQQMRSFLEKDVSDLIQHLERARIIIGFNLLRFDYEVLKPYGLELNQNLLEKTIDLLEQIHRTLGFRVALDNLVRATLGEGKLADGRQSVRWYRQGNIEAVVEYCEMDVQQTWKLFSYGLENRQVFFTDRRSGRRSVPATWKLPV
jgi:DEAD/DEAH box helicase domain-containing protein